MSTFPIALWITPRQSPHKFRKGVFRMTFRVSLCGISILAYVALGALPAAAQQVDFGDDSSIWAMDGECDDPRFTGAGMAADPQEADILADASDCSAAFDAGRVSLDPAMANAQAPAGTPAKPGTQPTAGGDIDFGDDSSPWAMDGECDDPRFVGAGMAAQPQDSDIMADATDCRTLYEAGSIDDLAIPDHSEDMGNGLPDFGADTSAWINDGECDDPRFVGPGMAAQPVDADIMADATDCRTLYEAGSITLAADAGPSQNTGGIDFGADSGRWTFDGECDDPRFQGPGSAEVLLDEDRFADATDCRTLFDAGMVSYLGDDAPSDNMPTTTGVDFGTDSGTWTFDGECDDPRFQGNGMASVLSDDEMFGDATDCQTLYDAGQISLIGE
jgi:hypothetical protein